MITLVSTNLLVFILVSRINSPIPGVSYAIERSASSVLRLRRLPRCIPSPQTWCTEHDRVGFLLTSDADLHALLSSVCIVLYCARVYPINPAECLDFGIQKT